MFNVHALHRHRDRQAFCPQLARSDGHNQV